MSQVAEQAPSAQEPAPGTRHRIGGGTAVIIGVASLLVGGGMGFAGARATTPVKVHTRTVTNTVTKTVDSTPQECLDAVQTGAKTINEANSIITSIGSGLDDYGSGDDTALPVLAQKLSDETPGYHSLQDKYQTQAQACADEAN